MKTITAEEYRLRTNRDMPEKVFQDQIVAMAKTLGWMAYHTHDSRRSEPGFPDLVIVRPADYQGWSPIIFAELKREDPRKGRVSTAQRAWLDALDATLWRIGADDGYAVVEVWRPSDLPRIQALLEGRSDWRDAA